MFVAQLSCSREAAGGLAGDVESATPDINAGRSTTPEKKSENIQVLRWCGALSLSVRLVSCGNNFPFSCFSLCFATDLLHVSSCSVSRDSHSTRLARIACGVKSGGSCRCRGCLWWCGSHASLGMAAVRAGSVWWLRCWLLCACALRSTGCLRETGTKPELFFPGVRSHMISHTEQRKQIR